MRRLAKNTTELAKSGVRVVPGELTPDDRYVMPFIAAETGQNYLARLLMSDKETFLRELDHFRDLLLKSSEYIYDDNDGYILRRGYVDMVPLNSFHTDDDFVFFDQEFCRDNVPLNGIMMRVLQSFYARNPMLQSALPIHELIDRYGLKEKRERWERFAYEFYADLRKLNDLSSYRSKVERNDKIVADNRERMNFSAAEWQRIFVDIFTNADKRKLFLFGAGKYTENFLTLYQKYFPVCGIVDNDTCKHGKDICGINVQSPSILTDMPVDEYKVIVCLKKYLPILKQLSQMGVKDYSVFKLGGFYDFHRRPWKIGVNTTKKKYHVGYVAGVFDLFHIGHLNILKRAKNECDYLIVGVVSDEGVRKFKHVEPAIPFAERIEIVRACVYVDEAHAIPLYEHGTEDAWRMYRFDAQFSGSDYEHNPAWLAKQRFLRERGADLVFFPYTQSTSSTKIKKLIEERLV